MNFSKIESLHLGIALAVISVSGFPKSNPTAPSTVKAAVDLTNCRRLKD